MAISQIISELSTPPSRSDPATFDSRADVFLGELPDLATEINTWAIQANTTAFAMSNDASASATAKTNAETAETNAETAQGLAESARDTAIAHAATATSQASAAGVSAGTAAAQAVIATDQAAIATTQANNAVAVVTDAFNELTAVQQYLIMNMEGLAGYWPADPQYAYQDSAGYTPASVSGVVGQVRDISNAATPVARRNLLTYSEQFDNGVWTKTNTTVTNNATTSPDGTLTADSLVETSATGEHYTEQSITTVTNQTYTSSVYVKANTSPSFSMMVVAVGSSYTTAYALFDISAESITTGFTNNGITSACVAVGNGWYRCSITYNLNGTVTSHRARIYTKLPASYAGDGTSGIYLWGAQVELGAEATPYQKIVTGTGDTFAPGNHAYQTTTANKPYLRVTPTSGVHWLDSNTATSALTATLGNLGAACTVCQAGAEGVTFTEGVTISSTYNIAPAYGFNGDVAIFNRALTTTEKALITRYMQRGVPLLSVERLADTGLDNAASWTVGTGWVVASSAGTKTAGSAGTLLQSYTPASGSFMAIVADLTVTAGAFNFYVGGTKAAPSITASTTSRYIVGQATGTSIGINGDSASAGTLASLSFKEVL